MICETQQDIQKFYADKPKLEMILGSCLCNLPITDKIYQGDFIGFGGKDEYTPNTITYSFAKVIEKEIIIAPHTEYVAESDLRDAVASPITVPLSEEFGHTHFVQPHAYVFNGEFGYRGAESFEAVCNRVTLAKALAKKVDFPTPRVAAQYVKELNACIREGREIDPTEWDNPKLIELWCLVQSIKEDALSLCRHAYSGCAAFIGDMRVDGEGYVMHSAAGSYKLVDRGVFSFANFSMGVGT